MSRRWTFYDPATTDTYVHQINPNTMTSPFRGNSTEAMTGVLSYRKRSEPREWTFGGVIRTQQQYEDLRDWATRTGRLHVTDHLGRTFEVFLIEFVPDEKTPTANNAWRFDYTMRALVTDYLGVQ